MTKLEKAKERVWEDWGIAHSQYVECATGKILGDVKEGWRCWQAYCGEIVGEYTSKEHAQRAVENAALQAAKRSSRRKRK